MSQAQFTKLCGDAKLLDKVSADILFSKTKQVGKRTINLKEFRVALEHIAKKKDMDLAKVKERVADVEGPLLKGTVPKWNKFHDTRNPQSHRGNGEVTETILWSRDGAGADWVSPSAHSIR